MERRPRRRVTGNATRPEHIPQPNVTWLLKRSCELRIDDLIDRNPSCHRLASQEVDRLLLIAEACL